MRERPILFNGAMVRAILAGQKTQTRRVIKEQPFDRTWSRHDHRMHYMSGRTGTGDEIDGFYAYSASSGGEWMAKCPFGQPGDRLWVRETWQHYDWSEDGEPCIRYQADGATEWPEDYSEAEGQRLGDVWVALSADKNFAIDGRAADRRWRPSIHMPRWACRLVLEITAVRVERLQAISARDCQAEGIRSDAGGGFHVEAGTHYSAHPDESFASLWTSTGGDWDSNPWVWVIEFKRVEAL